jgi:hypothetical protein
MRILRNLAVDTRDLFFKTESNSTCIGIHQLPAAAAAAAAAHNGISGERYQLIVAQCVPFLRVVRFKRTQRERIYIVENVSLCSPRRTAAVAAQQWPTMAIVVWESANNDDSACQVD